MKQKRLVLQIDVDANSDGKKDVEITPLIIPLATPVQELLAEQLISLVDNMDKTPGDGEFTNTEKISLPVIKILGVKITIKTSETTRLYIDEIDITVPAA